MSKKRLWKCHVLADGWPEGIIPTGRSWDLSVSVLSETDPAVLQPDLLLLGYEPDDLHLMEWLDEFRRVHPLCQVLLLEPRSREAEWYRAAVILGVDQLLSLPLDEKRWKEYIDELSEALDTGSELSSQRLSLERRSRDLSENREKLSRLLSEADDDIGELHIQLTSRISQLSTLYQLGRDLSSQANWNEALEHFLTTSANTLDFSGISLLLWSFEGRRLAPRASLLLEDELLGEVVSLLKPMDSQQRLAMGVFAIKGGKLISELALEGRDESWELTVVPLVHGNDAQGFLLYRKYYSDSSAFDSDFHFLKTVQTILSEELAHAKAVQKLKRLGEFNRTVLDSVRGAVLAVDGFGTISYRNPSAAELFGDLMPLRGPLRLSDFLVARDGGDLEPGEDDWIQREVQLLAGPGKPSRDLLMSTTRLYQRHPQEVEHVLVFEDLTEYKCLESELRQAERLAGLGQLSAGVAHEIRNPLAGISMLAQLLNDRLGDEHPDLKSYVEKILGETERLNRIVQSLLEFSRPVRTMPGVLSLYELLGSVRDLVQNLAERKGVTLQLPGRPEDREVWADRGQMQQVFLNLLRNAIEASEEGGEVGLTISEADSSSEKPRIRVSFWDRGEGVPPEFVERLFNPFFTTKAEGTGLGLAICLKIVQEHGGSIRYRERVGGGAEFILDLQPAPRQGESS